MRLKSMLNCRIKCTFPPPISPHHGTASPWFSWTRSALSSARRHPPPVPSDPRLPIRNSPLKPLPSGGRLPRPRLHRLLGPNLGLPPNRQSEKHTRTISPSHAAQQRPRPPLPRIPAALRRAEKVSATHLAAGAGRSGKASATSPFTCLDTSRTPHSRCLPSACRLPPSRYAFASANMLLGNDVPLDLRLGGVPDFAHDPPANQRGFAAVLPGCEGPTTGAVVNEGVATGGGRRRVVSSIQVIGVESHVGGERCSRATRMCGMRDGGGERASAMWLMDCRCRTWSMLVVGSPFGGEILVRSRCLVGLSMVYTC